MERYLEKFITEDMKEKIILLSGPRQVGKTTLSRQLVESNSYLNYDSSSDRRVILAEEWNRDVKLVVATVVVNMCDEMGIGVEKWWGRDG